MQSLNWSSIDTITSVETDLVKLAFCLCLGTAVPPYRASNHNLKNAMDVLGRYVHAREIGFTAPPGLPNPSQVSRGLGSRILAPQVQMPLPRHRGALDRTHPKEQ